MNRRTFFRVAIGALGAFSAGLGLRRKQRPVEGRIADVQVFDRALGADEKRRLLDWGADR